MAPALEGDISELSLASLSLRDLPPASSSSSTAQTPSQPLSPSTPRSERPSAPLRIPSSPSSSALSSPPLPPVPLAGSNALPPHLLRTQQRKLSRSNSTPRSRRAPSHDLSTPPADPARSTAALNRWAAAFVVVNFDLDVGPVIERAHPSRRWAIGVGENVAFSSFPDTSLFAEGRVGWSFKLNDDDGGSQAAAAQGKGKTRADGKGKGVRAGEGGGKEDGRLWGFVQFVQKRDGTIKRGYFQKSLVILTPLAYPSLFSTLVAYLAPLYFAHGPPVLEQACREISAWPDPTPGATLELPFLGETFTVQIPERHQASQLLRPPPSARASALNLPRLGLKSAPPTPVLSSAPSSASSSASTPGNSPSPPPPPPVSKDTPPSSQPTYQMNGSLASRQHAARVLLGAPAASASMARSVSGTYGADAPPAIFRPAPAPLLPPSPRNILASLPLSPPIPLFSAAILPSLWVIWECLILAEPLLVIAPDPRTSSEVIWWLRDFLRPLPPSGDLRPYFHIHDASFSLLVNAHQPPLGTVLGVTNPFFRTSCAHWPNVLTVGERLETSLPGLGKRAALHVGGAKGEAKEGFKTRRKRMVSKDKVLLKRWEHAVGSDRATSRELNDELRFHFSHLTEKFLVPLNRYFGSLIPTDLTPDAQNRLPPLKPFLGTTFLASLKAHGHALSFRSDLLARGQGEAAQGVAFYEAFLRSKYFGVWLAGRCEEAEEECQRRARRDGWTG